MANQGVGYKSRIRRIIYFFPFQLFILHLKRNYLLLFFWVLLFGYITQTFAVKYGVPYLFLSPEYMGESSLIAFAILGFSVGGFIMAFNIYSYVMHGHRFPFIATLSRPFMKFSLNNFIIPFLFVVTYLFLSAKFQSTKVLLSNTEIAFNLSAFIGGMFLFFFISFLYFFRTNKNIFKFLGKKGMEAIKGKKVHVVRTEDPDRILQKQKAAKEWYIETYMANPFKIALARESAHYDDVILKKVFVQNHINASIFEVVLIITFVVLGSLREVEALQIPTGASISLLFTILLMVISGVYSWFGKWTFTLIIAFLFIINMLSAKYDFFKIQNHAYGLNYNTVKADYSSGNLDNLRGNKERFYADFEHNVEVLNKWRLKNVQGEGKKKIKPKFVIVNCSGGGLRSSLWTYHVLTHADSLLQGDLMKQMQFVTGSSGGMLGAAYLRELYLRSQKDSTVNIYDPVHKENITKDMLNAISFSLTTYDLFVRYQSFKDGDYTYKKDRAYTFEQQLNKNTGYVLDKRLVDYYESERNAEIPMMVLAPAIINDGRRLLIASQPISYLTDNFPEKNVKANVNPLVEDIEFTRMFEEQDASNLRFTSALRMSATFPYITPIVSLPSKPRVEVMDAGLRDNFGVRTSLQYLYTFRNWISTNTSGVVIINIRDKEKDFEIYEEENNSILQRQISPFGSLYGNFARIHDYTNDRMIQHASQWFDGDIDIVTFQLVHQKGENISLSWHLTPLEKKQIIHALDLKDNAEAMEHLKELLE